MFGCTFVWMVVYVYVFMYGWMCVCLRVYVYVYVCIYVHMYIGIYVDLYTCIDVQMCLMNMQWGVRTKLLGYASLGMRRASSDHPTQGN